MEEILVRHQLKIEQRNAIVNAIKKGKEEYLQVEAPKMEECPTKKSAPHRLYDVVNKHIVNALKENPNLNMTFESRRSGFHPYIALHDFERNINVLISKLHRGKEILAPSRYRGEFSESNVERLLNEGYPPEKLPQGCVSQATLDLGIETLPFTIIVCYDPKNDIIYEGALMPNQESWIYKLDITDSVVNNHHKVNIEDEVIVSMKKPKSTIKQNDEIVVNLKNKEDKKKSNK